MGTELRLSIKPFQAQKIIRKDGKSLVAVNSSCSNRQVHHFIGKKDNHLLCSPLEFAALIPSNPFSFHGCIPLSYILYVGVNTTGGKDTLHNLQQYIFNVDPTRDPALMNKVSEI